MPQDADNILMRRSLKRDLTKGLNYTNLILHILFNRIGDPDQLSRKRPSILAGLATNAPKKFLSLYTIYRRGSTPRTPGEEEYLVDITICAVVDVAGAHECLVLAACPAQSVGHDERVMRKAQ
jgi:hypothetical protein